MRDCDETWPGLTSSTAIDVPPLQVVRVIGSPPPADAGGAGHDLGVLLAALDTFQAAGPMPAGSPTNLTDALYRPLMGEQ